MNNEIYLMRGNIGFPYLFNQIQKGRLNKLFRRYKICGKCHECLPILFFRPAKRNPDGLNEWCFSCQGKNLEEIKEEGLRNYIFKIRCGAGEVLEAFPFEMRMIGGK